jgi:hypothetical protein
LGHVISNVSQSFQKSQGTHIGRICDLEVRSEVCIADVRGKRKELGFPPVPLNGLSWPEKPPQLSAYRLTARAFEVPIVATKDEKLDPKSSRVK